jgi:hypothetical protein
MTGLREQLLAIHSQHGYLTPQLLVDEARPKEHALHSRFEWNDKLAGESWRRDQAHRLIQSVRVSYLTAEDEPGYVRGFLALPAPESQQPTYEPVQSALSDPITRQIVLAQMEREWKALRARYGQLAEFAELVARSVQEAAA